jgi:hypothetical protein
MASKVFIKKKEGRKRGRGRRGKRRGGEGMESLRIVVGKK